MKVIFVICFLSISLLLKAQDVWVHENINAYVHTTVRGYIEIRDQAYYERLDKTYKDHIGLYNKAMDYYLDGDFESAYFYFNEVLSGSYFKNISRTDKLYQNKIFYTFMSIIRMKNPPNEVRDCWQLVNDVCDPERKRIAKQEFTKYKHRRMAISNRDI